MVHFVGYLNLRYTSLKLIVDVSCVLEHLQARMKFHFLDIHF